MDLNNTRLIASTSNNQINKTKGFIDLNDGCVLRNFGEGEFNRSHCFGIATKMDYHQVVRNRTSSTLPSTSPSKSTSTVSSVPQQWQVIILSANNESTKNNW